MGNECKDCAKDRFELVWNCIRGLWIWAKIDLNAFLNKIKLRSEKKYVHVLMTNMEKLIYDVWPKCGICGENVEMVKKAYLELKEN